MRDTATQHNSKCLQLRKKAERTLAKYTIVQPIILIIPLITIKIAIAWQLYYSADTMVKLKP